MHSTSLRKVGGSVMLAVPPAFLDQLHLRPGSTVGLAISEGCLVIDPSYLPAVRPRYSLAELLSMSDYTNPPTSEQREWVDAPAVGGELL
jgi:antitoxin ChpS